MQEIILVGIAFFILNELFFFFDLDKFISRYLSHNKKAILYVDMDGVLANYHKQYMVEYHHKMNKYPQSRERFFLDLEPIEGGVETLKELMSHFDVYILTRPSYLNPLCYTEKRLWIEKYFGVDFCEKIIISCDKSLLKGDYLIDDTLKHGQLEFEGELLHFGKGNKFENWESVKKYLYKKNGI